MAEGDWVGGEWASKLSKKEAKELLSKWRDENTRCPEKVRDIWLNVDGLDRYLGDEKWPVLEQVCIAAMDLHDVQLINECLTELRSQFSNSTRVRRLQAMAKLEMRERYEDADKLYRELIKEDPANSSLYKRRVAVLIAQRRISEAIKELTDYLLRFMNDQEAWLELCDLYIHEQEYHRAAFCVEELILNNPHNHLYHTRYAEIQYTINTPESMELAKMYFAQALRLNPSNLRALYGLSLAVSNLAAQPRITPQKKKEMAKLASWASQQISKLYRDRDQVKNSKKPPSNKAITKPVEEMLAALQVSSNN